MTHAHHDSAGSEGFAAASWMMAMFGVIIAVVLAVALLVWAPWNDNGTGTTNTNNNTEQQAPADEGGSDGVNIEGNNVDVGDVPEVPSQ